MEDAQMSTSGDGGGGKEQEGSTKMEVQDRFRFPIWKAHRRKLPPDSPFFATGNLERELLAKQVILDISEEEKVQIKMLDENQRWEMICPVVGCKAKLNGLKDLESHYFSRHSATCSVCLHVFPTNRLLDLHISETHDSFFQAKAARGHPMYKCLVEGCDARFQNDASRHQHLVDKHKFPPSFHFHKKKHLSQKMRRRVRMHQPSNLKDGVQEGKGSVKLEEREEKREGSEMRMVVDDLTSAVSRLSTMDHMPSQVSFGRRHNRGFTFIPRSLRGRGGRAGGSQRSTQKHTAASEENPVSSEITAEHI